jgi:hypothetical protein
MVSLVFISEKFSVPSKNVSNNNKNTLKEEILYSLYQLFKENELVKTADVIIRENNKNSFHFVFSIVTPVQESYENLIKELENEINPVLTKILGEQYSFSNEFIFLPNLTTEEIPEPTTEEVKKEQSTTENVSEPNKPI